MVSYPGLPLSGFPPPLHPPFRPGLHHHQHPPAPSAALPQDDGKRISTTARSPPSTTADHPHQETGEIPKLSVAHIGEVNGTDTHPPAGFRVCRGGLKKEFFFGSRAGIIGCPTFALQQAITMVTGIKHFQVRVRSEGEMIIAPKCHAAGSATKVAGTG